MSLCLCFWLQHIQAKWKMLCGEDVVLTGNIAFCCVGDEPLFLDEDLACRLFGFEVDLKKTWTCVAAETFGITDSMWPPCGRPISVQNNDRAEQLAIPTELVSAIAQKLSLRDVLNLSSACHETRDMLFDSVLWQTASGRYPDTTEQQKQKQQKQGHTSLRERLVWSGAPCIDVQGDQKSGVGEEVRDWCFSAGENEASLLRSSEPSCKTMSLCCTSMARAGDSLVACCEDGLTVFREGKRGMCLEVQNKSALVVADSTYVCLFDESRAMRVFDHSLNQMHTIEIWDGGPVFAGDICNSMLAVAQGPELTLVNLEEGKMIWGKTKQVPEVPEAPEVVRNRQKEIPSVQSEKYVAANQQENNNDDEYSLEVAR
jgi:hypothetical protein